MTVNSKIEDKKLEAAIEMLKNETPIVYVNLKKLVVDIAKKYLSQNAEEAFINRHFYDYTCYKIDEKIKKEFLGYVGLDIHCSNAYMLIKKSENFAMLFTTTGKFISAKKPLYEEAEINDILCVFNGELFMCSAEETV